MPALESPPGRTALVDGQSYLYFSGTAYLGIPAHPVFQAWVMEGFQRFGTNYGGSRLSSIRFGIYEEVEQKLAEVATAPAALTVSSGTLAGQLLVRMLAEKHEFYYAPGTHPALFQERAHTAKNWASWVQNCLHGVNNGQVQRPVLLANSLDPLYAKSHDFSWLGELNRPAILVLDDSHGMGITGKNGGGVYSALNIPEQLELLVVASLGKAFGVPGGVILGKPERLKQLRQSPFFGGASPVIPAYLYAFLQSEQLYADLRAKLQQRITQFSDFATSSGQFSYITDYPVFYTQNDLLAEQLAEERILVSNFPYPTTDSPLITRIILNALHTHFDVTTLTESLPKLLPNS